MNKEQNDLDERQLQIRNNIFKHSFFIAITALALNAWLNSIGIIWADPVHQNIMILLFISTIVFMECHFHDVTFGKDVPRIPTLLTLSVCTILLVIVSIIIFVDGAAFVTNGMLTGAGAMVIYCVMFLLNSSYGIIQYLRNKQADKIIDNSKKSKVDKIKRGL